MAFTNDQNLEQPTAGQADWDTSLNANFAILERGNHFRATTGMEINSGEALSITGSGTVVRFDAASGDLQDIHGVSYANVQSGEEGFFVHKGIIRSLDTNTFTFAIGEPVFVSSEFPGLLVSSDGSGSGVSAGISVDTAALIVAPFRTVTGGGGAGENVNSADFWTGVDVVSVPAAGQVPQYNGTAWEPVNRTSSANRSFEGAIAIRSSDLTGLGTGENAISWSDVSYDTSGIWSGVSPTRLTVPSGVTKVKVSASFRTTAIGINQGASARITQNGSAQLLSPIQSINTSSDDTNTFAPRGHLATAVMSVDAADYFELSIFSNDSNWTLDNIQSWFSMEVIERSDDNFRTVLEPVKVAAQGNTVLASAVESGDSIDGIGLVGGDRVLLPAQTTDSENGIYVVGAGTGAPTRAADMDEDADLFDGMMVPVLRGTDVAGQYMVTSQSAIGSPLIFTKVT